MTERHLASRFAFILHADVAGSTGLVQKDEHLAHQRIQDAFRRFGDIIVRYRGHVRELRGDALLAEFERASDAVSAALAFQAEQADSNARLSDEIRPEVRVGIAMGEVVVADGTVTGAGVVLAQRLEQLAHAGGVCIQGAACEAVPQRLPFEFESLGEQSLKGFDGSVRAFAAAVKPGHPVPQPEAMRNLPTRPGTLSPRYWLTAGLVAFGLVLVGVLVWMQPWRTGEEAISVVKTPSPDAAPLSDNPTVAVLPFDNLSNDPEQEYFSDGISEDIITDLSQVSHLGVIARNSSFAYRDTPITIQDLAKELGAQYVLEGSVRRSGDRVRITAQLIDAATGRSLWADRYDRLLVDIFELQDEIRDKIVTALSIQLMGEEAEHLSRRSTRSFEAYDLFLRGQEFYRAQTLESLEQAEALYRRAIALDPGFARAYGALGVTLSRQRQVDFAADDRDGRLDEALEMARKAVSIDPTSPQAQWALGFVHTSRGEPQQAATAVEKSVTLSPNFADGWALLSQINNILGRGDQALRFVRKARALNPRYSLEYLYSEGRAYYNIGEYEKAVEPLLAALARNENALYPRAYLAASYVRLGRMEDAEWEATQLEVNNPGISLSGLEQIVPLAEGEHRNRFFEDLRKAGLPE